MACRLLIQQEPRLYEITCFLLPFTPLKHTVVLRSTHAVLILMVLYILLMVTRSEVSGGWVGGWVGGGANNHIPCGTFHITIAHNGLVQLHYNTVKQTINPEDVP